MMAQQSTEKDALLPQEENRERTRKPIRRTVVVEPLLFIGSLSGYPLLLLVSQYVFQQMAKLVAREYGIENATIPETSEDPCAQGVGNGTSSLVLNYTLEVQARSSMFGIYSNLALSLPSMLAMLFLGAYSDKVGRRFAILPPLLASLASVVLYVFIVFLDLSVYYVLVASLLSGLGGGYLTLLMGCFTYIADTTVPEKRAFRIVVAEFCMLLSNTLMPIVIGLWIQRSGYLGPFVCVLAAQVIAVLYGIFLVPETVVPDRNAKFFTLKHVETSVVLYTEDDGTRRRWKLDLLLLAFFFSGMMGAGTVSIAGLYQMNHPLCWGSDMVGTFAAVYSAVGTLGGVALTRLLKNCTSDNVICLLASIAAVIGNTYVGFVRNSYMMIIVPVFFCFGLLLLPNLRAIMSKLVRPEEQGALFGSISCVEVLTSVLASVVFNLVYTATIDFYTGFVYWVMAFVAALGCATIAILMFLSRNEKDYHTPVLDSSTKISPPL